MRNDPSSSLPGEPAFVAIEILPVEEEADELATLAATEHVYGEIQREARHLEGYVTKSQPSGTRGANLVLLIGAIAGGLAANNVLATSIFHTISRVIELLAKRERVQEIEIKVGTKSLLLKDVRTKDARQLIDAAKSFVEPEIQQTQTAPLLPSEPLVKIQAKVSKQNTTHA